MAPIAAAKMPRTTLAGRIRSSVHDAGADEREVDASLALLADVVLLKGLIDGAPDKTRRLSREPCPHGAKYRSACRVCSACPHGRQRCRCKDCGGASICSHGRKRTTCRECGGGGPCGAHARQRSLCKECGGGSICAHGRRRVICKDCGGAGLCPHGRQHHVCKPCGGASICAHGRRRDRCKPCVAKKFIAATSKS